MARMPTISGIRIGDAGFLLAESGLGTGGKALTYGSRVAVREGVGPGDQRAREERGGAPA